MLNSPKKTMVCVTVQRTCERLIREGAAIAGGAGLSVVHVARNGEALLGGDNDGEALEYLYRIAREYGAEMDMLRADDTLSAIVDFAKKNRVECIVVGAPAKHGADKVSGALRQKLSGVSIVVMP